MNLIRQRDKLKEMHRAGALNSAILHRALQSPVFEWDGAKGVIVLENDKAEFLRESVLGSNGMPKVAPFDCFRIARKSCFDQWYKKGEEWTLVRCSYADPNKTLTTSDDAERLTVPEHWSMAFFDARGRDGKAAFIGWINGKPVAHEALFNKDGTVRSEIKTIVGGMIDTLSYFMFETFWPGNTILRIEPPRQPGRSVEWRLARTHWVVLNRHQAQRCMTERRGPTDEEIVRAAHWRRAHLRRLKSERFKPELRGKLVPVKKAWVGPLEWEGLDGKVYKVEHVGENKT